MNLSIDYNMDEMTSRAFDAGVAIRKGNHKQALRLLRTAPVYWTLNNGEEHVFYPFATMTLDDIKGWRGEVS